MIRSRRDFFRRAFVGAGALASAPTWAGQQKQPAPPEHANLQPDPRQMIMSQGKSHQDLPSGGSFLPVQTPDVPDLPWEMDNGVKVFHLVAEPVKQTIWPDKTIDLWGYNGSCPGPTIQITQGDRVRVIVDNHLPEPTSMHWHGFEIPIAMDGGPGISQDPIRPGGRFVYEFTLHQEGTYFYHSHMAMQEMIGMRCFHHASQDALRATGRQGLCHPAAGICGASQQHRS